MAEIKPDKENLVLTWNDGKENRSVSMDKFYENLIKLPVYTSKSASTFQNAYTNIDIRDEYSYYDYENYRPNSRIPKSPKGKIAACMQAYEESGNGIIRNTVDLMADFATKGINVVHKNKKVELWWQTWFHNVVGGPERSERIVNLLPRAGLEVVQKNTAKLELRKSKEFFKGNAAPNSDYKEKEYDIIKREIPVSYNIVNPLSLEVDNEQYATLLSSKDYQFAVRLPDNLIRMVNYPNSQTELDLLQQLPVDLINNVRGGSKTMRLDKRKTKTIFYKKDDWKIFPTPMLYSVLKDLQTLQKMKLADDSALDGVISQLRVWKLGNLEYKIFPDLAAMQKLAGILMNAGGGGITDIIWGPDLQLQEITTNYQSFLGEAKYIPVLNAIWTALGIPALFTGSSSQGSFTSNYIAIQTLIERLESFRNLLINFWEAEFKEVMIAMKGVPGFDIPPVLVFDKMILSDPSSIYQILTNMVDRNILSEEFVQNVIGANPDIEEARINREEKERKKGKRAKKSGPYYRPQVQDDWMTNFINQGVLSPSQVGLELLDKKPGEKNPQEIKVDITNKLQKTKINNQPNSSDKVDTGGRPLNSKDQVKRKPKKVAIRTKASFANKILKVESCQEILYEKLNSFYLEFLDKKNLRQLTVEEFQELENYKFRVLSSCDFSKEFCENYILDLMRGEPLSSKLHTSLFAALIKEYQQKENKEPTTNVLRKLQCVVCACLNFNDETDNSNNDL